MLPGEKEAVQRLRQLTGAAVDYCHMALVVYGSVDVAAEHIRTRGPAPVHTGTPYRPRRRPTHHQELAAWWRITFGAPWPRRSPRHQPPPGDHETLPLEDT